MKKIPYQIILFHLRLKSFTLNDSDQNRSNLTNLSDWRRIRYEGTGNERQKSQKLLVVESIDRESKAATSLKNGDMTSFLCFDLEYKPFFPHLSAKLSCKVEIWL